MDNFLSSDKMTFLPLIKELCIPASGVIAPGNNDLFDRLKKELPFTVHRYPSGSVYNGWTLPPNWRVEKALLKKDGQVVFDGTAHTLGVARLSKSFQGILSWDELKSKLVTNPHLPEAYVFHCAWQYRPWDADWALSVPYKIYKNLGPGDYEVDLVTRSEPGEMLVAEYHHQGRSDKTIIFNSNTCHPHMANDGFCGSALLIRLMQALKGRETFYSYKLILAPEHLGSVFYLKDKTKEEINQYVSGLFLEMVGTEGPLKATSTFLGNQKLDQAMSCALSEFADSHELLPWRMGAGNDETVWEAPGVEIPFVELTRSRSLYEPYPEYHTSLDSPELMREELLQETFEVLKGLFYILENDHTLHRTFDGLICLSNPQYDLYQERPDPAMDKTLTSDADAWGRLQDSLQRYFDGSLSIVDIAMKHQVSFKLLFNYLKQFEENGLIEMRRAPIERPSITQKL